MDEEMEYAEMLEIPVSTVNVTKKRGRKPKTKEQAPTSATTAINPTTSADFSAQAGDKQSHLARKSTTSGAKNSTMGAEIFSQASNRPSHSELAYPQQSITDGEWLQYPTSVNVNGKNTVVKNSNYKKVKTTSQREDNKETMENGYYGNNNQANAEDGFYNENNQASTEKNEQAGDLKNSATMNTLEGMDSGDGFDFIPQENAVVCECSPIAIPRRKKRPFLARLFGGRENVWMYEEAEKAKTPEVFPEEIEQDEPQIYNYNLYQNKQERESNRQKHYSLIAGIEFAACVALCAGIFLTNVFYPTSAINTFFRSITQTAKTDARTYTDFTLSSVLSEENAELNLSPAGILSFTEKGCVYPAVDGTVTEITQNADGTWMVKIAHSPTFTGIINGLSYAACSLGSELKSNVPVGYSNGEAEVQVSMYDDGALLNCFHLTESGNLAWTTENGDLA